MSPARILIVDDEPFVRKTLGRVLGKYELVLAASGEEALEHLDGEKPFDLILCDLMMPVVSGMELYERLREQAPGQEDIIVFLTGGVFTADARDFVARISNPVIEKPFDFQRLRSVIDDMLGVA